MSLENLSDESLFKLYENIREQVSADLRSSSPHRFMGEAAKERAHIIERELERRRLSFHPIYWP